MNEDHGVDAPPTALPKRACSYHFDREARSMCAECGAHVCSECFERGEDGLTRCVRCLPQPDLEALLEEADREDGIDLPPALHEPSAPSDASEGVELEPIPWESPSDLNDFQAFFATSTQAIFSPTRFMERVNWDRHDLSGPFIFALLSGSIGQAVVTMQGALSSSVMPPPRLPIPGFSHMPLWALMMMALPILPLLLGFALVVKSWMAHALLGFMGATPRPFSATFKVFAYAEAASLLLLIPVLGPYADKFMVVFLVLGGLRVAQGTGLGAGLLALLPVLAFQLVQL